MRYLDWSDSDSEGGGGCQVLRGEGNGELFLTGYNFTFARQKGSRDG